MIDRMFIAVLLLSISGFVFCTIFFPLERYAYRLTTAKTMIFVNMIALFSFVIPLYRTLSLIDRSEDYFRDYKTLIFEDVGIFEGIVGEIREMGIVEHLSSIWLLGAMCFFIKYVCKYFHLLHKVRANKFYMEDNTWVKIFNRLKHEKNMPNVRLICCYAIFTPCSIGIKDSYIVIPASMINAFNEDEMEFILEHEFYHILHRDLTGKLLVMLFSSLNWFNPQFRSLRIHFADWLEAAADEAVTAGFTFKKRLRYSQLIAKVMELERAGSIAAGFCVNFRGEKNKKNIRRIKKIMQKKEAASVWSRIVVVCAALFSLFTGNVIAKAADVPINQMFSKNAEVVKSSEIESLDKSDFEFVHIGEYTVPADIRNAENAAYEIISNNDSKMVFHEEPPQADPRHIHKFENIILKVHEKYKNGSCKTTYYEGTKCTSCGVIWKGSKINAVTQEICTH